MTEPWQIRVFERSGTIPAYVTELDGPLEFGRQDEREGPPYFQKRDSRGWRLVVARMDENAVSRRHLRVDPLPDGRAKLTNVSLKMPVFVSPKAPPGAEEVTLAAKGGCMDIDLPVMFRLDTRSIELRSCDHGFPTNSLDSVIPTPGDETITVNNGVFPMVSPLQLGGPAAPDIEGMIRWMQAVISVLETSSGMSEFFDRAARALVDLVRLDAGRVLVLEHDVWRVRALQLCTDLAGSATRSVGRPSQHILGKVRAEKRTFWQETQSDPTASLIDVGAVVAAPLLNRTGAVIGALYGDRALLKRGVSPLNKLDAMLVELLATGVSANLARVEQEQMALKARVQFEQFFTQELAAQLTAKPDLLNPRDADVTIMFCDIRDYSRISLSLGPAKTLELVSDVMGMVSEAVLAEQGVLVDYIGDELMAMWGAPDQQPDHGIRACRAALAVQNRLPAVNGRWQSVIGEPVRVGIGINSGPARVGNTGTRWKFKYGPLGSTVNLASRVQGATKYLKVPMLLTDSTWAALGTADVPVAAEVPKVMTDPAWAALDIADVPAVAEPGAPDGDRGCPPGRSFHTRRLCRVAVVGMDPPVTLHELAVPGRAGWPELKAQYETALAEFEKGYYASAAHILSNIITTHRTDGPSLQLLSRAVNALIEPPAEATGVWTLPGK